MKKLCAFIFCSALICSAWKPYDIHTQSYTISKEEYKEVWSSIYDRNFNTALYILGKADLTDHEEKLHRDLIELYIALRCHDGEQAETILENINADSVDFYELEE